MTERMAEEIGTALTIPKLVMTYRECAAALGLTEGALRIMVHRKQIPYTKLGSRVRFIPKDIEAWLKKGSRRAQA